MTTKFVAERFSNLAITDQDFAETSTRYGVHETYEAAFIALTIGVKQELNSCVFGKYPSKVHAEALVEIGIQLSKGSPDFDSPIVISGENEFLKFQIRQINPVS